MPFTTIWAAAGLLKLLTQAELKTVPCLLQETDGDELPGPRPLRDSRRDKAAEKKNACGKHG